MSQSSQSRQPTYADKASKSKSNSSKSQSKHRSRSNKNNKQHSLKIKRKGRFIWTKLQLQNIYEDIGHYAENGQSQSLIEFDTLIYETIVTEALALPKTKQHILRTDLRDIRTKSGRYKVRVFTDDMIDCIFDKDWHPLKTDKRWNWTNIAHILVCLAGPHLAHHGYTLIQFDKNPNKRAKQVKLMLRQMFVLRFLSWYLLLFGLQH